MPQVGGAIVPYQGGRRPSFIYSTRSRQRGGGILSVIKRFALPLVKTAAKTVLPHISNIAQSALGGEDIKTAARREAKAAGAALLNKGLAAARKQFITRPSSQVAVSRPERKRVQKEGKKAKAKRRRGATNSFFK